MTWLHGIGSDGAQCAQQIVVMVALLGATATAIVLAGQFLNRQRRDPLAMRGTSPIQIKYVLTEGSAQRDTDNDQWHRRLM